WWQTSATTTSASSRGESRSGVSSGPLSLSLARAALGGRLVPASWRPRPGRRFGLRARGRGRPCRRCALPLLRRRRQAGAVDLVADGDREMARTVLDEECPTHGAWLNALERRPTIGRGLHHAQVVEVSDLVVVLGVGDSRPQHLLDQAGRRPRSVLE